MAATGWKRLRRAARAAAIRAGVWALGLVPRGLAMRLAGALAPLAWSLSPALRRDMRASLAVAFPEKTDAERDAIALASLANLGRTAAEVVTMRRWLSALEGYVRVPDAVRARVEAARARNKGIVLVMGHIGNWELTCRLSHLVQPNAAIAKRSWHPSLDRMAEAMRARTGVMTFWRDDPATGRAMLRLFKQGGTLGILVDQDIPAVQSVFVPFFGRLAATPRAAADFAIRFGTPVLVVTCHRRGPGPRDGHELDVVEVPYDPAPADREAEVVRLTAACVAVQEAAIRRHPAEWVWMHQRWRSRPEAAEATAGAGGEPTRQAQGSA